MMEPTSRGALILLLDTCAERASVALMRGMELVTEVTLPERTASAGLLKAVREVLGEAGAQMGELSGLGVVSGPGSFTGVRVGLAMAKGLCEAAGLPMAAVSRLEVLADAAGLAEGYAVLRAGRGQVFVRQLGGEGAGREWLMESLACEEMLAGQAMAYCEAELAGLAEGATDARFVEISAKDALRAVQGRFSEGGSDLAHTDANYVRNEEEIYARKRQEPAASAG